MGRLIGRIADALRQNRTDNSRRVRRDHCSDDGPSPGLRQSPAGPCRACDTAMPAIGAGIRRYRGSPRQSQAACNCGTAHFGGFHPVFPGGIGNTVLHTLTGDLCGKTCLPVERHDGRIKHQFLHGGVDALRQDRVYSAACNDCARCPVDGVSTRLNCLTTAGPCRIG